MTRFYRLEPVEVSADDLKDGDLVLLVDGHTTSSGRIHERDGEISVAFGDHSTEGLTLPAPVSIVAPCGT